MSLSYYAEEDIDKENSINSYDNFFYNYKSNLPSLYDALYQMMD